MSERGEVVAWALEWVYDGETRGMRLYDDETHCVFDAESDGGIASALVRQSDYLALREELDQSRAKNRELNRRCQKAEAAIPEYQRIVAMPPDGDGVRFILGSFGRALLGAQCEKLAAELAALKARIAEAPVCELHEGMMVGKDWCYGYLDGENVPSMLGRRVRLLLEES